MDPSAIIPIATVFLGMERVEIWSPPPAAIAANYLILDFIPLFRKNTLGLNDCVH